MVIRFKAEKVEQKDIKAGDLLSTLGPEHWDTVPLHKCSCDSKHPIMARIMIAVNEEPKTDIEDEDIYRITLYTDDKLGQSVEQSGRDRYGPLSKE